MGDKDEKATHVFSFLRRQLISTIKPFIRVITNKYKKTRNDYRLSNPWRKGELI